MREALEGGGCVVVADVGSASAALDAAREHEPDVCLLDINMPGSGLLAAADITQALPGTAVVMLTASRDDEDLFAALRAGAAGYLVKDMDPDRDRPRAARGARRRGGAAPVAGAEGARRVPRPSRDEPCRASPSGRRRS